MDLRLVKAPTPPRPTTKRARARPLSRRRVLLIENNMQLVRVIAKNVGSRVPPCFDLDDMVGAGNLGLFQAAKRFHWQAEPGDRRSVQERFVAYARRRVEGAIKDVVRRRNWTEATATRLEDISSEAGMFRDERQRPEDLAHIAELRRELKRTGQRMLKRREQRIVAILYGTETTVRATAEQVDLSPSRTGQIARGALAKMQPHLAKLKRAA